MHDHSPHLHAVRFYDDSDSLCRIVGEFIGVGLEAGEPAIVVATQMHAERIDQCLRKRGLDVDGLKRIGDYVTVDARETLATFMLNSIPNAGAFHHHMGLLIGQVLRNRERTTLRIYGEMVDVLWKDGREAEAIRVETLWNELANTHSFKLLCGYAMGNFYKGAAIEEIKRHHSHVVNEQGEHTAIVDPDRAA
jgi:hypothetical protein